MMVFDINFDIIVWVSLGLLIIAAALAIWARFLPMTAIARHASFQTDLIDFITDRETSKRVAKVSVVVYNVAPEEILLRYIPTLMEQDYPNFEVVLVNDGNNEVTAELAERLTTMYPERLYVTFIPPGSHNLSRRKLALTLGIKAAKGDIILTTSSNCRIPSSSWLSLMMEPFAESKATDIVLGYSHIDQDCFRGAGKWYREFDDVITASQWLGSALRRKAYRGDGNNLVFRRDIFFEQKGYARSIHLVNGDDDLFINDISTDINTEVMLAPQSILSVDWEDSGNRMHADLKERYQFTSILLPKAPFLRSGLASCMQWLAFISAAVAIILGLPNLLPAIIAAVILLGMIITQTVIYTKTAHRLGASAPRLALPLFLLWLPFGNLLFRLNHRSHRKKNFTFA